MVVPSLAVRVSKRKTFVVVGRFGGSHPTRRSIGSCVSLTLDEARDKARGYHREPKRPNTFASVAEAFFVHIKRLKRSHEIERGIRRELMPRWHDRPIASITKRDVIDAIDAVLNRGFPSAAHHLFADIRRLFNFAIARDTLEHSPCDRLKPKDLIGPKPVGQRVLTDDELRALWRATTSLGYPFGPLYRLLLVTGQRKSEVAYARWREVDTGNAVWTIPPERFKSNATHMVPLSPMALAIINALPRSGDLLFGHINGFGKNKRRLDKAMGRRTPLRDSRYQAHRAHEAVGTARASRGRRDGDRPRPKGPCARLRSASLSERNARGVGCLGAIA
jgi:integrase